MMDFSINNQGIISEEQDVHIVLKNVINKLKIITRRNIL